MEWLDEHSKNILDSVSLVTALGTLLTWIPPLAAFFSLVWSVIRIYETKTVQGWLKKD